MNSRPKPKTFTVTAPAAFSDLAPRLMLSESFLSQFSFRRRTSTSATANGDDRSGAFHPTDVVQLYECHFPEEASPTSNLPEADPHQLATDTLTMSMQMLKSASTNIPSGSIVTSVVDPLLDITDRIRLNPYIIYGGTGGNGGAGVGPSVELLQPMVSKMVEDRLGHGGSSVDRVKCLLESITMDLNNVRSYGVPASSVHSDDNARLHARFNAALKKICTDLKRLVDYEVRQAQDSERAVGVVVRQLITMGNVSGGTGGGGGAASVLGGMGGMGGGPMISIAA